jgi:mevalonate kinase
MTDIGYGKVILFGEHFVVHGCPAIAAGISNKAIVRIKESTENSIITEHAVVPEMTKKAIAAILGVMNINKKYTVYLEGDLPTFGGMGSSAAFCVALVKCLAKENNIQLTSEKLNDIAYQGEKAFHGNPSGIDNTMATYGGLMLFTRGKTPKENKMERFKLRRPLHLVVGITGKFGATTQMIRNVQEFKDNNPEAFSQLLDETRELIYKAMEALERLDLPVIGRLMNENQKLLEVIGVSTEDNEKINNAALDAGALGAKLTGGGGGGCCIALASNEKEAEKIFQAVKKVGYEVFITTVS